MRAIRVTQIGRYIYSNDGDLVWKYTFARQPSEMQRYAKEFNIGKYVQEVEDRAGKWFVTENELSELKSLAEKIKGGLSRQELEEIGISAIRERIKENSEDDGWRETFKEDIEKIKEIESIDELPYSGASEGDYKFEPYSVGAEAIEGHISDSLDFLHMTEAFIDYIEKSERREFEFQDEY